MVKCKFGITLMVQLERREGKVEISKYPHKLGIMDGNVSLYVFTKYNNDALYIQ
jgi:hypothetical protein